MCTYTAVNDTSSFRLLPELIKFDLDFQPIYYTIIMHG